MAKNFTNENFERFLQQNADGLRMRPSEKVWKGIAKQLNQRRRKFGFGLALALLITSGTGYLLLFPGLEQDPLAAFEYQNTVPSPLPSKNTDDAGRLGEANRDQDVVAATGGDEQRSNRLTFFLPQSAEEKSTGNNQLAVIENSENHFTPTVRDESHLDALTEENPAGMQEHSPAIDPLTIESVLNSFRKRKKSKLSFQTYFTPTVSYRKLSENKAFINSVPPANAPQANLYTINSAVTHKPDFGFEIGFTGKYALSGVFSLRAGVQLNVNRYDIKTFNTSTQLATIALNDRNQSNTLTTSTNYNNFSGYDAHWLENFYFQASAPVGVEAIIKGHDRVKFGIASTVQPTYVLGDRAYLISTDYKNYAEVPSLIRRWNVNTSLETFVSYSTGQLKWQVGPQVRYQLLSSFVKKYPVKENLFDFGLKVGVGINK